jgi:hypothetical protein
MANHPNRAKDEKLPVPGTAVQVVDFGGLGGLGTEELGIDDLPTPLLRILHYQCPQITRGDPKFINGAEPGNICDVSVNEAWEGETIGLDIVVCGTKRRYQEWIPRPMQAQRDGRQIVRVRSGNFRGFHELNDPVVGKLLTAHNRFMALPWTNSDGETVNLIETGELFVMFAPPPLNAANAKRAMINFQSTSLRTWTTYNGRHGRAKFPQPNGRSVAAPLCFWRWRLRSQPAQNPQDPNQRYFVWSIELSSKVDDPNSGFLDNQVPVQDPELYEMALASLQQYRTGEVKEYKIDDDEVSVDPDAPPF